MADITKRPVSPINGVPLPPGKQWKTREEAREAGKKGGKRSAAVRAQRKTLREELILLLSGDIKSKEGQTMNAQAALSTALLQAALKGNVHAFEIIRDTIGEKPMEKVMVSAGNFEALDEAFAALKDDAD